jgi:hypothetical protein
VVDCKPRYSSTGVSLRKLLPGASWCNFLCWPVVIEGSAGNDPAAAFNSFTAMQRPGLLLLDDVVSVGFASHCDVSLTAVGW